MSEHIAIAVSDVSKLYSIGANKDGSLRGTIANFFKPGTKQTEDFWALKNVSFEIKSGEVIGIIGKNGAGKSTLLKILSQITKPTSGRIVINGRVASLLEVGTGFHPELSGRENIFLNGTILGMTRKEVARKFDEIVAFSGVEKFIDTPVKYYSSGMYVRLAFSVAAHLDPEILIIDEVLAVGDAEFQNKCLGKMKDVAGSGRTVIFVSHQLGMITKLCNKSIFFEKGQVKFIGPTNQAIQQYLLDADALSKAVYENQSDKELYIERIAFESGKTIFFIKEEIILIFKLKNTSTLNDIKLGVGINNDELNRVFTTETSIGDQTEFRLKIPSNTLTPGRYYMVAGVHMPNVTIYDQAENVLSFEISDDGSDFAAYEGTNYGNVFINCQWI